MKPMPNMIRAVNFLLFVASFYVDAAHHFLKSGSGTHRGGVQLQVTGRNASGDHPFEIFEGGGVVKNPYACDTAMVMNENSKLFKNCPAACPLFAEDTTDTTHCSFRCVQATTEACKAMNPKETVVDLDKGFCRPCYVEGCSVCAGNGKDECMKCSTGYRLVNGLCESKFFFVWYIVFAVLGTIFLILGLWLVDLANRKVTNQSGLDTALATRSRAKNHMPKSAAEHRMSELIKTGRLEPHMRLLGKDQDGWKPCEIVRQDEEVEKRFEVQWLDGRQETAFLMTSDMRPQASRNLWDLTTNLTRTESSLVAGPGIVLQFNFQASIICWAFCVAIGWFIVAKVVDDDLLVLGKKVMERPHESCIVVAWGYVKQHALMWVKFGFVLTLYLVSFVLAICFSIRQMRVFQEIDADNTTYKDFAARVTGLPTWQGSERVEEFLKEYFEKKVGEEVLGVSVCWDYVDVEDDVMQALQADLDSFDSKVESPKRKAAIRIQRIFRGNIARKQTSGKLGELKKEDEPQSFSLKKIFAWLEGKVLAMADTDGPQVQAKSKRRPGKKTSSRQAQPKRKESISSDDGESKDMPTILTGLKSTDSAFVVFRTEKSRDAALEKCESEGGFEYRVDGDDKVYNVVLQNPLAEPDTTLWSHFRAQETLMQKLKKYGSGIGTIVSAFLVWTFCFYLPYATYVMNFNYSHGQEPGIVASMSFSMIVVAGNATMYFVCSVVAESFGFHTVDNEQACYMLLYCSACMFNVALDMVTTYFYAYKLLVGQGVHTYDGVPLQQVTTFTEVFETYAMQKSLGENLWLYSFPSTFLIPFVLEPVFTIYVPYKLVSLIIRSHPKLTDKTASMLLQALPMDLSRYADIHLNLILAVLIFYFPGGYTMGMFLALAGAHVWIYMVDQFRILRTVPRCDFAAMVVDWWSQWMLSVPIGLLLSCFVFKSNCEDGFECHTGVALTMRCTAAFFAHVIVHTLVLLYVVPRFGKDAPSAEVPYQVFASNEPYSWFASNPIFCLRSQHIYGHYENPCLFSVRGQEHLLKKNEELHLYFEDEMASAESYDKGVDWKEQLASLKRAATQEYKDLQSEAGNFRKSVSGMIEKLTPRALAEKLKGKPSTEKAAAPAEPAAPSDSAAPSSTSQAAQAAPAQAP